MLVMPFNARSNEMFLLMYMKALWKHRICCFKQGFLSVLAHQYKISHLINSGGGDGAVLGCTLKEMLQQPSQQ